LDVQATDIPDVLLITTPVYPDGRGFFTETYRDVYFAKAGLPSVFVQDNESLSHRGVLRGLHYQIRHPQGKLVRAVVGEIFDIAVDLRRSSPTFTRWVGVHLSAENHRQMWIPSGFAHGYLALTETVDVLYKTSDYYAPQWERTLLWNDSRLAIAWPLEPGQLPILSERDTRGTPLDQAETYE
jgi:dTDP-4-dehydrorhamnose 3,5-epimerase